MYVREIAVSWNRKGNNLVGEASIETCVGLALAVCCWVRTEEYYKTRSAEQGQDPEAHALRTKTNPSIQQR